MFTLQDFITALDQEIQIHHNELHGVKEYPITLLTMDIKHISHDGRAGEVQIKSKADPWQVVITLRWDGPASVTLWHGCRARDLGESPIPATVAMHALAPFLVASSPPLEPNWLDKTLASLKAENTEDSS